MPDQTINQLPVSLKNLNLRLKKLGQAVDRLDILAYQYKPLCHSYRQLAIRCQEIADTLDHMDVVAFEMRQAYTFLCETCERIYSEFA